MAKGLLVSVFRNVELGDSTNGGVTSKFPAFVLTGPGIPGIFEAREDRPELRFCVEEIMPGLTRICARPVVNGKVMGVEEHGGGAWMFGGNYVHSSDSRFPHVGLKGNSFPIPVHDRCESAEMLRAMGD